MGRRKYTIGEQQSILRNECVIRCSETSIVYKKEFKVRAVKQYVDEGLSPRDIFEQAGFDLRVIGKKKPKECLLRWRRIMESKGEVGLLEETRGKGIGGCRDRPKTTFGSDKEEKEYLKAKIAYLEAENAFLAKLRAQKRAES